LDPLFLSVSDIIDIHDAEVLKTGEPADIINIDRLEAAVAMPMQTFGGKFLYPDIPAMAAAYAYFIARGHAFIAGNKRAADKAALVFLIVNGYEPTADPAEYAEYIQNVVDGTVGLDALAAYFRSNTLQP
jgi:death-on-curing protein